MKDYNGFSVPVLLASELPMGRGCPTCEVCGGGSYSLAIFSLGNGRANQTNTS